MLPGPVLVTSALFIRWQFILLQIHESNSSTQLVIGQAERVSNFFLIVYILTCFINCLTSGNVYLGYLLIYIGFLAFQAFIMAIMYNTIMDLLF